MEITVAEMKANLSEVLRKAAEGEEVRVTKHGKPYVTLRAASGGDPLPRVGAPRGQIWIADDFDELGPEWEEYVR